MTQTPYNTDDMAKEFLMEFHNSAFPVGQPYVFQFQDKPLTQVIKLLCVVMYRFIVHFCNAGMQMEQILPNFYNKMYHIANYPKVIVGDLEISDMSRAGQGEVTTTKANIGLSFPNTAIIFEKAEGTSINLIGKSKGKVSVKSDKGLNQI